MSSFQSSGAGKGPAPRKVDPKVYSANHTFIFGVFPSYQKGPDAEECALRGQEEGKCWGSVENFDYLEPDGDMVTVCRGHSEYFDWCSNKPGSRKYINETEL